ncbi:hypothetical protein OKA04_17870 [Luteolibacter flavescens]|uniref:Uncharacterized protein n=1 Tax=Luteolibacter flavescens TaxID=1859460 RepID=A0ABT3FTN8_9BACT|nr:hypothetical protein [Luteolibacter flavescens]MCW1886611.1 hypothetical protein [Luteolibacter flavescens]
MKKIALHTVALGVLLATASAAEPAEETRRVPMRDVVTHDQIVEAARLAREDNPPPVFKPLEGEDPSVVNRPKDLLSRSEIFSYRGKASLVPKRAVLHFPKELSDRKGIKEESQFLAWIDFYAANRAWIRTVEVTRAQAEGKQTLDEGVLKSFEKERRLVIATYQEGPISVIPAQVESPDTSGTATSAVAKP